MTCPKCNNPWACPCVACTDRRQDMTVPQVIGIIGTVADSMPDLVRLLDETDGWTRMQQRRRRL